MLSQVPGALPAVASVVLGDLVDEDLQLVMKCVAGGPSQEVVGLKERWQL